MIDILKKELEKKIGRSITNRGDCELLSNIILEVMDIEISFNTLRRLYGIIPSTNPNKKTLNTLAQFLGYKNYFHFTQNYNYKEKIDLTEIIYNTLAENDPEEIINIVNKTKNNNQDFITMIIIATLQSGTRYCKMEKEKRAPHSSPFFIKTKNK